MSLSASFLEDRRSLNLPRNGVASTSSLGHARPPVKRTASTASVNDHVMDMLNPRCHKKARFVDSDDDESGGIGVQEDWELEDEHDPFAAATSSNSSNSSNRIVSSPSGSSSSATGMALDSSPTSSPIQARHPPAPPSKRVKRRVDMMEDMDDAEDNPFLASGPPKAPSKRDRPVARPDKVSYVFRGKRITYDAPIESLFPKEDEDDLALFSNMKSGPRVLFPSPPTPSFSVNSLPPQLHNASPPSSAINANLLMHTPRRKPASEPVVLETPADRITAALAGERAKKQRDDPRAIPPTPASLPQKSKADREVERERLHGAMRGIQAVHAAAAVAHRGESSEARNRRLAQYAPR